MARTKLARRRHSYREEPALPLTWAAAEDLPSHDSPSPLRKRRSSRSARSSRSSRSSRSVRSSRSSSAARSSRSARNPIAARYPRAWSAYQHNLRCLLAPDCPPPDCRRVLAAGGGRMQCQSRALASESDSPKFIFEYLRVCELRLKQLARGGLSKAEKRERQMLADSMRDMRDALDELANLRMKLDQLEQTRVKVERDLDEADSPRTRKRLEGMLHQVQAYQKHIERKSLASIAERHQGKLAIMGVALGAAAIAYMLRTPLSNLTQIGSNLTAALSNVTNPLVALPLAGAVAAGAYYYNR